MANKRVKLTLVDGDLPPNEAQEQAGISLKGPCPADFPEDLFKMLGGLCDTINGSIESGEMTAEDWERLFEAMGEA